MHSFAPPAPRICRPAPRPGVALRRRRVVMACAWEGREKRLEFVNGQGEKLVGSLVAAQKEGPCKTVVLCHGFSDHRDTAMLLALAAQLDAVALSSFRFDFSGNGESEGRFEFGNYLKEREDLRSAVQYLRNAGHDVHGVVGHSKGGNVVVLYAAEYDDVPCVVNVAGRFDMKRGVVERYGKDIVERLERFGEVQAPRKLPDKTMTTYTLTKDSLDKRLTLDMAAASKAIKKSRVLTIHGTQDMTIPVNDAREFAACIPQHELHLVEEGDHNFSQEVHLNEVVQHSVAFLSRE